MAEKGEARRTAGLAALDAGDYERALIDFTEAKALLGDKANVEELLRVTEDLRSRPRGAQRAHQSASSGSSVASRSTGRGSSGRRVAVKEEPAVEVPQVHTGSQSGLVIVTTTPRGLLVQVDDTAVDLTPMRTKVKPGPHRLALLDGNRKVYETTIDVKEGGTTTVLKDLPMPLEGVGETPSTAPPPAPPPPVASVAKEESPRPIAPVAVAPMTPPPPAPRSAESPAGLAMADKGTLQISSPGLYGVVWINGRPRGYPPLEVRDLPAGPAKVEVRVNGIQKRSSTVVVREGVTTPVNLRSQEAVP